MQFTACNKKKSPVAIIRNLMANKIFPKQKRVGKVG